MWKVDRDGSNGEVEELWGRFENDGQVSTVVKETYIEVLGREHIILSRMENNRLLRAVLQETLSDMLANLSDDR